MPIRWADAVLQGQRGALMPWSPVCLGAGVAAYFALPVEPGARVFVAAAVLAMAAAVFGWRFRGWAGPPATAVVLCLAGLMLAGWRAQDVAGPVLGFRYYGPIEGRIVAIDRSASDALRLTLDEVVLARTDPARTPLRVRVSLHGEQSWLVPSPGARVAMTGHLSPPEGPAEPGGFDFQRHAWFLGLGAVGYTRTPALMVERASGSALLLSRLRMDLSEAIRARIDGQPGAFAAAVLTGDRSGLSRETLETMRASNIAHLIAISGLHMGLLTGFVFGALRLVFALLPSAALRLPAKKIAAGVALLAGAAYLALSGGNVATERAFVQVGVMFAAVMIDRRAITLRSVAIAAVIVLLRRPETLFSPGFQMSFAATAALVAVFEWLRGATWLSRRPGWLRAALAVVISSAVAGAATAPFSAAHFNQIAVFGLAANLLSVPVMGSLVIPAAVIAALLWPFGLEALALWPMEQGLAWILGVAAWVTELPGATRAVAAPRPGVLAAVVLGGLFLILWRGRGRMLGLMPLLCALVLWPIPDRPQVLISATGRLVGAEVDGLRVLSRPRGDGFVAGIWLENDGDRASQQDAAGRPGWQQDGSGRVVAVGDATLWHGSGRRAAREAEAACAAHDILVISEEARDAAPGLQAAQEAGRAWLASPRPALAAWAETGGEGGPCRLIDGALLRETGAVALWLSGDGGLAAARIATARAGQGERFWTSATLRDARLGEAGLQ